MSSDVCTTGIRLDDHVKLGDKRTGTVLYIGNVKFATGDWFGIALDDPFVGKNDGTVRNKRYFTCRKNKGAFVKRDKIVEVLPFKNGSPTLSALWSVSPKKYMVGQRINCNGRMGSVRWVGELDSAKPGEKFIGIELDMQYKGNHDGSFKGTRYFSCTQGQGIFAKVEADVKKEEHPKASPIKLLNTRRTSRATLRRKSTLKTSKGPKTRWEISEEKRAALELRVRSLDKELEDSRLELEKRINEYEEKINEHEQAIQEAEKLLDTTKRAAWQEINHLESKLERTEREKLHVEEESQTFKQKLAEVEDQLKKSRKHMNQEREHFVQETRELRTSRTKISDENIQLLEDRRRLEVELNKTKKDLRVSNKKIKLKETELADAADKWTAKNKECVVLEQKNQEAQEVLSEINKKLEFEMQRSDEFEKKYEDVLNSKRALEEKVQDTESKLSERNGDFEKAQLKILGLDTALSQTKSLAQKAFDEERKRAEEAEMKLSQKKEELFKVQALNLELETKHNEITAQAEEYVRLLEVERIRILELKSQFDLSKRSSREEFEQLQAVLESVEKANTALERECEELKQKLKHTDDQVMKNRKWMNKERELFLQEKSEQRASIAELSNQNQQLVKAKILLESHLREKENRLSYEKSDSERKKKQLEEANDTIASKTELFSNLEQDLQDLQEELTAVRGELKFETKSLKQLEEKYKEAVLSKNSAEEKWVTAQVKAKEAESKLTQATAKLKNVQVRNKELETQKSQASIEVKKKTTELEQEILRRKETEVELQKKWNEAQTKALTVQRDLEIANIDIKKWKTMAAQCQDNSSRRKKGRSLSSMIDARSIHNVDLFPLEESVLNQGGERQSLIMLQGREQTPNIIPQQSNSSFSINVGIINTDSSDDFFDFRGGDFSDHQETLSIDGKDDDRVMKNTIESKDLSNIIPDSSVAKHRTGKLSMLSIATSFSEALSSELFSLSDEKIDSPLKPLRENTFFFERQKTAPTPEIERHNLDIKLCRSPSDLTDHHIKDEVFFEEKFDQQLKSLEKQIEKMVHWIEEARKEIVLLPVSPKTFDEILAAIEPERLTKVKQKFNEIGQLTQKRKSLTGGNEVLIRKHFQDRIWKLVAAEKNCERNLRKTQKSAKDKMGNAAFELKKNIRRCMDEYWRDAKSARNFLEILSRKCNQELPFRFETIEKAQVAVNNSGRDEERLFNVMENVKRLKRMGKILGNVKSPESLDCMYDSIDLEIMQDSVCEKLGQRTKRLKFMCQERRNEGEF